MTDTMNLNELLDNEQTATLLGIKPNTLEIWRCRGIGPNFVKMGTSKQAPVRYQRGEVASWLERQSFGSTSAYSTAAHTSAKPHNLRSISGSI